MKRIVRTRIKPHEAGKCLIDLLTSRFSYHDRQRWLELVGAGRLLVNGLAVRPDCRLKKDDDLEYVIPPVAEPPVNIDYSIIFEDENIFVVNKPPNLPCHPAGPFFANTLWAMLRQQLNLDKIEFVNRLDRETSGLVLLAKTAMAARECRRQFEQRLVEKRYLVIVEGDFPAQLQAVGHLDSDSHSVVRKKRRFLPIATGTSVPVSGKWVDTTFRLLSTGAGLSLVEALLGTGRQHQIRATLGSLGYPVVGDKIYGVDDTIFVRFCEGSVTAVDRLRLRLDRQALHATSLKLAHPRSGAPMHFETVMPADMAALLESVQ